MSSPKSAPNVDTIIQEKLKEIWRQIYELDTWFLSVPDKNNPAYSHTIVGVDKDDVSKVFQRYIRPVPFKERKDG